MTNRMDGKKVVVVGAGQPPHDVIGNGRAISLLLAREGADVCAVDRDPDRANETVDLIHGEGGRAHAIVADVMEPDECAALVTQANETMGRIDALIDVVGGSIGDNNPLELDVAGWQQVMDLNLRAAWLLAQAVIPVMSEHEGGSITYISSVGSKALGGRFFSYGVAKAGLNALTRSLAAQYAPAQIRCNAILPSWVLTPHAMEGLVRGGIVTDDELEERGRRSVPLGRMGTAWDVAYAALYLSSDESSFVTGLELPVDGGTLTQVGRYQGPPQAQS